MTVPSWEVLVVWIWRIMSRLLFVVYPNNQKAQANLIFIWSIFFFFWKLCPRVSRENAAGNSGHDFWPLERRRAQHTETSSEPLFEKRKKIWLRFVQLTLRRPLRKKLRMRWFFDVCKVKESSFKSDLTDPPQIFDAHLLVNTDLSLSRFSF